MHTFTKAGGAAVAAVALTLALSGCGSDSETEATSSASTTSSTSETSQTETETSPTGPKSAVPAAANQTIADYIKSSGVTETPVKRGAPGSPTVELPIPAGWEDAGPRTPAYAWSALLFTGDPAAAADPPTIVALMSKLTGDVDPAKIIEFAPGELKNLPGFQGGDGEANTLAGFDAYQIGGTYVRDGVTRLIAQKTVVIPADDGLYVIQFNADGVEAQARPLMDATAEIDAKTVITP
jgi:hypothetical protein